MSKPNALQAWFGIPETGQPLDYYILLGLELFEDQPDKIKAAYRQRRVQLEPHLQGDEQERANRMLARLRDARDCLLDVRQKARYDAKLQALRLPSPAPTPTPQSSAPAAQPEPPPPQPASARRGLVLALSAGALALLVLGVGVGMAAVWLLTPPASPTGPGDLAQVQPAPLVAQPDAVATENPPANSESETAAADSADAATTPAKEEPTEPTDEMPDSTPAAKPPATTVAEVADEKPSEVAKPATFEEASGEPAEMPDDLASQQQPVLTSQVPPPPPAIAESAAREEYVAHVRSMLEVGLGKSPNRDKARIHFQKALALCDSDPRLYYGYALVVHTIQRDEATSQLIAAMKQGAHAYPPAWRLLIDLELKKSLDQRVVKGLPSFARRLEEAEGPWPDAGGKAEFALFLGRVVGFCQGPSGAAKRLEAELAEADRDILATLGDARRQAYELGKADVAAQVEVHLGTSQRKAETASEAAKEQQAEAERQLAAKRQDLADNEEKLKRERQEYDEKWNKMKIEFQREFKTFEFELTVLQDRMRNLQLEVERKSSLLQAAQMSKDGGAGNQTLNLIAERSRLNAELDQLQRQALVVQTKAQFRLQEMGRAEAEYQRATGQAVSASSFLAEKQKTIGQQAERLVKQRATKTKAVAPATQDLKRFALYAPLNVEDEAERLLASYVEQP